jgi:phenylacetic acid degradation operon negative regulatory protein
MLTRVTGFRNVRLVPSPSAKSLVLDLLSTLREGAMPVRALVEAGAMLGVAENATRVALARLLAAGSVTRDERGRYRLGTGAAAVGRKVASWRRLEHRVRPWTGDWVGVCGAPVRRADRGQRRLHTRALRFLGFRPLFRGLDVRPDNLSGGVDGVREELHALGLDHDAAVFLVRHLDAATEARARRLWDTAAIRAGYRRTRVGLERSAARLETLAPHQAMAESFRLGGAAIREIVLDPLLPEPIFPATERDALVETMRDYDRRGRACWAGFLGRFGVPHRQAPADVRLGGREHPTMEGAVA